MNEGTAIASPLTGVADEDVEKPGFVHHSAGLRIATAAEAHHAFPMGRLGFVLRTVEADPIPLVIAIAHSVTVSITLNRKSRQDPSASTRSDRFK